MKFWLLADNKSQFGQGRLWCRSLPGSRGTKPRPCGRGTGTEATGHRRGIPREGLGEPGRASGCEGFIHMCAGTTWPSQSPPSPSAPHTRQMSPWRWSVLFLLSGCQGPVKCCVVSCLAKNYGEIWTTKAMEHKGRNMQYLGILRKGNCNHAAKIGAEWKVSASIDGFEMHAGRNVPEGKVWRMLPL